jgi:hypothetical protein
MDGAVKPGGWTKGPIGLIDWLALHVNLPRMPQMAATFSASISRRRDFPLVSGLAKLPASPNVV